MKTKALLTLLFILTSCFLVNAQLINVPADYPTIQSGIDAAQNGDTVMVAEGTYFENIDFLGKAITLASNFVIDQDTNHIANTIIDGSQPVYPDSASVVRFISGEDTSSVLSGFTIRGGKGMFYPFSPMPSSYFGGGIMCLNSGPKIVNNHITNNNITDSIGAFGGGLAAYILSGDFWLVVKNNVFSNNSCIVTDIDQGFNASGGGMYITGNATIENNKFYYNSCESPVIAGGGGATLESLFGDDLLRTVYFNNNDVQFNSLAANNNIFGAGLHVFDADAYVDGNTISNNTAISQFAVIAPGVNFFQFSFGGLTSFTNNVVANNFATGIQDGWGTGFNISHPTAPVLIQGNHFYNNQITADGTAYGTLAIWVYDESEPASLTSFEIDGNIFEMNEAEIGAAIVAFNQFNTRITNNLFFENNATELDGGAIFMRQQGIQKNKGKADRFQYLPKRLLAMKKINQKQVNDSFQKNSNTSLIANNNFVSNSSNDRGGAVYSDYNSENLVTFNNIFWENVAVNNANDVYVDDSLPLFIGYSNITESNISGPWTGENNFDGEPMLENDFIHLSISSPCINAGITQITTDSGTVYCPDYDFDAENRPYGSNVDVGADESLFVGISPLNNSVVDEIKLYPNPTSKRLKISFTLETSQKCIIQLVNSYGTTVKVFANQKFAKGEHTLGLNISSFQAGVYFINLIQSDKIVSKRMVIIN